MEKLFKQLKCKTLLKVGSTANPYIKNPRDTEYYAVYDSLDELNAAPNIYNVHKYTKDYVRPRYFVWGYLFHFYNNTKDYLGEKFHFEEPTIEQLLQIANGMINSGFYNPNIPAKFWYHIAMVKAIEKYGYDNIPESAVQAINDLHDLKVAYADVTI